MSGSQVKFPSVSVALANADAAVQNTAHKVLIVGQMTAAGSATSGALVTNIGSSGAPENSLFGQNSQLAAMIRAFRKVNKVNRVDAIGLDDHGSGVPRVVDFEFGAGPATAVGTVTLRVASEEDYEYSVAVAIGDTGTDVADALEVLVDADSEVPFTLDNVAGAVTLTAVNDGTVANDLGVEVIISGATGITLSTNITNTTPGSQDPTLTSVLDVANAERYQTIVWPWADTTEVESFLGDREDPTNAILDGVAIVSDVDSYANHLTALGALNDRNVVIFCDKAESDVAGTASGYLGPSQNEASYVKSSYFAAIRALRLTTGQNIASYVVTSATLDQFGGPALASLPYANTPMDLLPAIASGRGWTDVEIAGLKAAGGSIVGMNVGGTGALVGEVVTTFKTDEASNPDPTFKYLNYVDTTSGVREYFWNNVRAWAAQARLTKGAISRGRDMKNEALIAAYCEKLYKDLAGPNYVLVQDGDEAFAYFKEKLDVDIDLATGTATVTAYVPIVTQMRVFQMTIKVSFSTA